MALFIERSPGGEVRQAPLAATSPADAAAELDDLNDERLTELFEHAEPRNP